MALIVSLICYVSQAHAVAINVYLKYDERKLRPYIASVNQALNEQGILARFQLEPFLEHFPLHTTLFLSNYQSEVVPKVLERVAQFSQKHRRLTTRLGRLNFSKSNYLMQAVVIDNQSNGHNHLMQQYSDALVLALSPMRDMNTPLPPWAKTRTIKVKAFKQYGSPNVFFEFSPHFSLLAKKFDSKAEEKLFQTLMNAFVADYSEKTFSIDAIAIAVGQVNEFGQVVHELAEYPL